MKYNSNIYIFLLQVLQACCRLIFSISFLRFESLSFLLNKDILYLILLLNRVDYGVQTVKLEIRRP